MSNRYRLTVSTLVLASATLARAGALSAQSLPPPGNSRAPLLTRLPADSIRLHVRQLRLVELLQSLQRGDSVAIDAAFANVTWGPADQAGRGQAGCHTLGAAVSALRSRQASQRARQPLPIFFAGVAVADSAETGVATATIQIALPSGGVHGSPIRLEYRDSDPGWAASDGLLAAVCHAAARASP